MLNHRNIPFVTSSFFIILFSFLIYSFLSDFGIRDDEGFYFYYLKHGIDEPTFTFFHTVGNFFGPLFGFNLLGFRLLNLFLLLISINLSLIFGYQYYFNTTNFKDKNLLFLSSLVSTATLGFFCFIPTFSYTSCATISVFFWTSVIFYISKENRKVDFLFYFLLIISFLFAISSRVQMFILLSFSLPFFLYTVKKYINKEKSISIIKPLLALALFTIVFISFHYHFIIEIFPVGKIIYQTTHDSLLMFYLKNIIYIFTHQDFFIVYLSFFMISAYLLLRFRFNINVGINILITLIIILALKDVYGFLKSYFAITGTPSNFSNRSIRYIFIITIFSPILIEYYIFLKSKFEKSAYKINKNFIFIFFVALFGSIVSSIGNNSNLIFWSSFSVGLTSIPFFIRILDLKDSSVKHLFVIFLIIFSINSSIIYRDQIYQFRRSPIKSENFLISSSPYLKNIKIDPYSVNVINNFISTLKDIDFNYKRDRIFAYPELPGLVASSNAKSFGDVHNQHEFSKLGFRELKAIEEKICAFIAHENITEVDNLYLLIGEDVPTKIKNCLHQVISKNSEVRTYNLGELKNIGMVFNDYNETMTNIKLIGPYKLKK
mgnify:FL=1